MEGSCELAEVLVRQLETQLHIFASLGIIWITSNHPSMLLLGKLSHSSFVLETIQQDLTDCSISFDVIMVISSWVQVSRALDFSGQILILASVESFAMEWRVHSSNCDEVIIDGGEMESQPCSPTITSSKPFRQTFSIYMLSEFLILGFDVSDLLFFNNFQNFWNIFDWTWVGCI